MTIKFWHFPQLLYEEDAEGHYYTAYCYIRTLPFTNSGTFPKYTQQSAKNKNRKKVAIDYSER